MKSDRSSSWMTTAILTAGLLLLCSMWGLAVKYETIEAIAMGQSTQLGQRFNVTIIIYEFSTDDDQKALADAFQAAGPQGMFNAVTKMKAKGHMAITGTLGYDINYIKEFKMPDGSRKIRLVTDRPLRFREVWQDSRSTDYNLSAAEIILTGEKKTNSGVLMPAMQLKLNKETNQIEVEAFDNPWKLLDIVDYLPKDKE
jgi:hypothetical protein